MARYEPDTKLLFLRIKPFREWCVDQQINYASLLWTILEDKTGREAGEETFDQGHRP